MTSQPTWEVCSCFLCTTRARNKSSDEQIQQFNDGHSFFSAQSPCFAAKVVPFFFFGPKSFRTRARPFKTSRESRVIESQSAAIPIRHARLPAQDKERSVVIEMFDTFALARYIPLPTAKTKGKKQRKKGRLRQASSSEKAR